MLGRGGTSEVWQGKHLVTRRPVAIKLLRRALACRPEMRRRFLREARAGISHPNVVEVLDAFELDDGTPAIVMPLLEGNTLAALIVPGAPLSVGEALFILLPVMAAVAATHAHGIAHRDLKPENVFLAREGGATLVKVLDFGVAKLVNHVDDRTPTAAGTLIGTPAYMAPEQAMCEVDQDHRVDVWAIGAMAYELLCGRRPVEGANAAQVIDSLLTKAITPLHVLVPSLPEVVKYTVMQMLHRSRAERPSLEEVLARLRPVLATELGVETISLGSERSWAAPEPNRSRSKLSSGDALASYHTVKPPAGAGSARASLLSKPWQQAVALAFASALGVVVAGGLLLGRAPHAPGTAATPLVSEPAPSRTAAAASLGTSNAEVAQAPVTIPPVPIAASVRLPVAPPRQSRQPVRVASMQQKAGVSIDKQPRPIDRTNPFTH
jgi:serine/threonine protein kinase